MVSHQKKHYKWMVNLNNGGTSNENKRTTRQIIWQNIVDKQHRQLFTELTLEPQTQRKMYIHIGKLEERFCNTHNIKVAMPTKNSYFGVSLEFNLTDFGCYVFPAGCLIHFLESIAATSTCQRNATSVCAHNC